MTVYDSLQEQLSNVHIYADYFMASCVWHGRDDHPSLMVHEDGFTCLTCHKSGTLEFLARAAKIKGVHVPAGRGPLLVLPRWRRWAQDYGDLAGIARAAHQALHHYPAYQWYFKRRKIEQFIDTGHFGYLDNWCMFPVLDEQGRVVDIVVRSTKHKQYVVSPSQSRALYVPDWKRVLESDTVYVVYGILDSWALYAVGLPVVTGTSGKSLSASQLKPLSKRYVIVPDQYEEPDAYRLAGELGWRAEVLRLHYPDGSKDPDDVRRNFNVSFLQNLLTPQAIGL